MSTSTNPVIYFEIPVTQLERAVAFYRAVFGFAFTHDRIDHLDMALFPFDATQSGITGALVKGEVYRPTRDGVILYFQTHEIDRTLNMAMTHGGKFLYPVTDNGIGLVAEFEDSEGNRIALFQPGSNH